MTEKVLPWVLLGCVGVSALLVLSLDVSALIGLALLLPLAIGLFMGVMFWACVVGLVVDVFRQPGGWAHVRHVAPLRTADSPSR